MLRLGVTQNRFGRCGPIAERTYLDSSQIGEIPSKNPNMENPNTWMFLRENSSVNGGFVHCLV